MRIAGAVVLSSVLVVSCRVGRAPERAQGPRTIIQTTLVEPEAEEGVWVATGTPLQRLAFRDAVELDDGRVLTVGGEDGVLATRSAEVWSPSSGQWTAVPPPEEARDYPLLSKLEDGRVLVVDRRPIPRFPPPARKLEAWDPRTNAWQTIGTFTSPAPIKAAILRRPHRLVVVDDLGAAQELDLATGTWQALGGPNSAPLLPHRALVVAAGPETLLAVARGGFATWTWERPKGTWTDVASPPPFVGTFVEDLRLIETAAADVFGVQPNAKIAASWTRSDRSWHLVTLPDEVYDSARQVFALADGRVLACQGYRPGAWTIAPSTSSAARAASLPYAFREGTIVPLRDGSAMLLTQRSAELWRPGGKAAGRFLTTSPRTPGAIGANLAQLADGRILYERAAPVGGLLWDPHSTTWTATAGTKHDRVEEAAIGLADGRVLVAGGQDPKKRFGYPCQRMPADRVLSSTEVWNPASDSWTPAGDLHQRQSRPALLRLKDGRVLALHGEICTTQPTYEKCASEFCRPSAQGEVWDPAHPWWKTIAPYAIDRPGEIGAAVLADGRVLIAGGTQNDARAEIWNPSTGAWSVTAPMSSNRVGAQVTALPDGRALVTGGRTLLNQASPLIRAAEVFDPRTNAWRTTSPMPSARLEHSAVRLADGRVLVAGCGAGETVARAEVWNPSDGRWAVAGNVWAQIPYGRLFAFTDGSAAFLPVNDPIEVWRPREP
jgi:hypothetical protein